MRRSDLLWLLAYPAYQIIGTVRHEGSHAMAALAYHARITRFVVVPSRVDGHFVWGYTQWSGRTGWPVIAAPYLCDLLTFAVGYLICTRVPIRSHAVWLNVAILGMLSPLVNSGYEYLRSFVEPTSDLAVLQAELPEAVVHAYLVATLTGYVVGLALVWRASRRQTPLTGCRPPRSR